MPEFKAPPKPLSFDFGLPFEEAIAQAKARGIVLPEEYYGAVMDSARRSAFTVSNLAGLGQIQAVHQSLLKALLEGITLEAWKREAAQTIPLPLARLETIYRTNVQTSYMAGHWRAFAEHQDAQPYLMYSAINDSRTRPAHKAMSGHIAPVRDPIWSRWSPPCGYNCRCGLVALTEEQAKRRGLGKQDRPAVEPDPGFGGHPLEQEQELMALLTEQAKEAPVPVQAALAKRLTDAAKE